MNQPLVSVCIPCYNASNFIAETIQSVLNQTYNNIEIIICDDQSTDNTVEVIKCFKNSHIYFYQNEKNLGCSSNYNQALSYATGKYTKLLCADDLISSDCIEKQVNVFEEESKKNISLVTANKYIIDEKGKRLFVKKFPGKGFYSGKKAIVKSVLFGTNIFGEPGLPLMKTDILRKTTGVIEEKYYTYCNDFDLWCKMLLLGDLYVINEPLFSFRIVNSSVTSNVGWKQAEILKSYFKLIYKNKKYGIGFLTYMIGKMMINIMTLARVMIYKLFLK